MRFGKEPVDFKLQGFWNAGKPRFKKNDVPFDVKKVMIKSHEWENFRQNEVFNR